MYRQPARLITRASAIAVFGLYSQQSHASTALKYDSKELPTSFQHPEGKLELIGEGMRRKFFLNVYMVGLYTNHSTADSIASQLKRNPSLSVAEILKKEDDSTATILLHFHRAVGKQQFINALMESFDGFQAAEIEPFKKYLDAIVEADGLIIGDRIEISWLKNGGVCISKNGKISTCFGRKKDIEVRLLEVYLDPKRSVTPDLIKSITDQMK
jgi:hypothetical protein